MAEIMEHGNTYATKGVANTALGLGIGGLATSLLNGGLGNLLGGGCTTSENMPVNRYELAMSQALEAEKSKNALLESQIYTDRKLTEVTAYVNGEIKGLEREIRHNREEQQAVNMQQAVLNGTTGATIGCIQGQIAQLMGITKMVVPNTSVCPGWGDVTITPAAATTT